MPTDLVAIPLRQAYFGETEHTVARFEGLTASTFLYRSGVAGLRIRNALGEISMLPFQGQQIWDAKFQGRTLTMRSMFDEPLPTQDYLRTYGAFFIHCGATAMGNPGPDDAHPLHGELPNAPYRDVQLLVGRDDDGPYMALEGSYQHTVAFSCNYVATPRVTLHERGGRIAVDLSIRNLRHAPMELMYLGHINFRPIDGAVLLDTVPDDTEHVTVRTELPGGPAISAAHRRMLDAVVRDLSTHRTMEPGRPIDPELVLSLVCTTEHEGWAHSMQLHPDGSADFVSHKPDQLKVGVRWISRGADHDALGLMLPATAGADGFTAEKAKGNVLTVPPEGTYTCSFSFGALGPGEAEKMRSKIEDLRRA